MIRFKDKILEDYFIDPVTAVITNKNGVVQKTYLHNGRPVFKKMNVHQIMTHTFYGYKSGYDVHHLDENKMNNALSNLVYLTREEHISLHNKGISPWNKGKPMSEETKAKMRKPRSEETKQKMRKPKSEETRQKMREAQALRWAKEREAKLKETNAND